MYSNSITPLGSTTNNEGTGRYPGFVPFAPSSVYFCYGSIVLNANPIALVNSPFESEINS